MSIVLLTPPRAEKHTHTKLLSMYIWVLTSKEQGNASLIPRLYWGPGNETVVIYILTGDDTSLLAAGDDGG